jgi:hypothetical protein
MDLTRRPGPPKEPTVGLTDQRDLELWELFQRFGRIPGIRIVDEPVIDWPAERVANFDALAMWDAWSVRYQRQRGDVATQMAGMREWMNKEGW